MTPSRSLASCLYEGEVRHRRFTPVRHEFRYRLFLPYVDLDELPQLFQGRWLWSSTHPNLAWFRRNDHFGPANQPLAEAVRDLVDARTGARPRGPIRLLTHFRYFGFQMNPISLFFCFRDDEQLESVVAEVNNTPWGERHCYVLDVRAAAVPPGRRDLQEAPPGRPDLREGPSGGQRLLADSGARVARTPKVFHVSPFLSMAFDYTFRLTEPGPTLAIQIENQRQPADDPPGEPATVFDATLTLRRRPWCGRELARALGRYPLMTAQVFAGIYWQAFQLWRKRVPYVPHPGSLKPAKKEDPPDPHGVVRAHSSAAPRIDNLNARVHSSST